MIAPHSPRWPRVVAEALAEVARPLAMVTSPVRDAAPDAVVGAWRAAVRPPEHGDHGPAWLLPHQRTPYRRVVAALSEWQGAILAEGVGRGKSWIALAAGRTVPRPPLIIGPAILERQWRDVAARAGQPMHWWSHERLSRGQSPPDGCGLVILDEAHRLREPATRRVTTLAPWLRGRRTLLLTATPIVNRLDDLVTLLRLFLPEDAFRLDGLEALGAIATLDTPPPALRRVVIRSVAPPEATPPSRLKRIVATPSEVARGERILSMVHRLTARHRAAWSRLLAIVLLDAAASSDVAFREALRRYRALLAQARDAGGGDRVTIRRFAGDALEQLVLWDLVGAPSVPIPLPTDDLPLLDDMLATFEPQDGEWFASLRHRIGDQLPSVWFTRHRATAAFVRTALGEGTAWVTGEAAGIGPHRLPRETILAAFGPGRATWAARQSAPAHLVTTDVAAEGLDLQAAGRLVHVDLPWTAMRLAQREGRLLRLGQANPDVTVLLRTPTPPIEVELATLARVRRKGALAERWLTALEVDGIAPEWRCDDIPCATVAGHEESHVVVIALTDASSGRRGVMVLGRRDAGPWTVCPRGLDVLPAMPLGGPALRGGAATRAILDSAVRWAVREAHRRASWGPPRLVARIHRLARVAAWHRDGPAIRRLETTLRWCTTAPTLGDRLRIERLATVDDAALSAFEAPATVSTGPCTARVVGVLHFRSDRAALRCPDADLPDRPLRPRRHAD